MRVEELLADDEVFRFEIVFQFFRQRFEHNNVRRRKLLENNFEASSRILVKRICLVEVSFVFFRQPRRTFQEPEIDVGQVEMAVERSRVAGHQK